MALLVGFAGWCACSPGHQQFTSQRLREAVIYDGDDRLELYAADASLQRFANSYLVALIPKDKIKSTVGGAMLWNSESLGWKDSLCPGERFREQPSIAVCSGLLVRPNLVLTAGHCVVSEEHCQSLHFVTGYAYQSAGQLPPPRREQVFSCSRRLSYAVDQRRGIDYAWVELDQAAEWDSDTPQLVFSSRSLMESAVASREAFLAVGFGQGLPAKLDPQVQVLEAGPPGAAVFRATLDAFTGASGMPVLDSELRILGMVLRGESDYQDGDSCRVARQINIADIAVAESAQPAEQVAYLWPALEGLCRAGGGSPEWCSGFSEGGAELGDAGVPDAEPPATEAGPPSDMEPPLAPEASPAEVGTLETNESPVPAGCSLAPRSAQWPGWAAFLLFAFGVRLRTKYSRGTKGSSPAA